VRASFFLCCCFADALNHKYAVDLFSIAADNAFSQFDVRGVTEV
jgi:hypothetical protein